jgi:hypothetical protein
MPSIIKVNNIASYTDTQISLPQGLSVPSGVGSSISNGIVAGVITATSFFGSGSELTNIPVATASKAYSYALIV